LKKDVAKLKTNQSARVNRSVKAELAEETPTVNFTDWAKTVEVRLEHLEEVFGHQGGRGEAVRERRDRGVRGARRSGLRRRRYPLFMCMI
jgi:hypothetical protein